jgi:hypothetical protein
MSKEPTPEQLKEWEKEAEESAGGLTNQGTQFERSEHIAGYIIGRKQSFAELTALKERIEELEKEKKIIVTGFEASQHIVKQLTARIAELEKGMIGDRWTAVPVNDFIGNEGEKYAALDKKQRPMLVQYNGKNDWCWIPSGEPTNRVTFVLVPSPERQLEQGNREVAEHPLQRKLREYFANVDPKELIKEFEELGYEFVLLTPKSTEVMGKEAAIKYLADSGITAKEEQNSSDEHK